MQEMWYNCGEIGHVRTQHILLSDMPTIALLHGYIVILLEDRQL